MDIRIAAIQYIILGLGLFIAIGYYGVIGCVIFIVAGVLAIAEYVQTKEEVTPDKKLFFNSCFNYCHNCFVFACQCRVRCFR